MANGSISSGDLVKSWQLVSDLEPWNTVDVEYVLVRRKTLWFV